MTKSTNLALERIVWERPELLVLVRSTPEEAVLTACKTGGTWGPEKTGCGKQKKVEDCWAIRNS